MRLLIIGLVTLLFFSCKDAKKEYQRMEGEGAELAMDASLIPGKEIVKNECYICHSPVASEENMIAPPMVAVKWHYIEEQTSKEEFTEALLNWLNDPQPEKVKMHGAVRKFGIMPYQPYTEEEVKDIASYLYETEIPQPEWYEAHRKNKHQQGKGMGKGKGKGKGKNATVGEEEDFFFPRAEFYLENGASISAAAQGALGKKLIKAIQEKGPEGAISFCKVNASGITDSVAIMNNVRINRVSDKPRNQENKASDEEQGYIIAFKRQLENQVEIRPILKEMANDEVYYYSPITTNAMCLQCHGTPDKEIQQPVQLALKNYYPEDKAVGYGDGEVRGMWKIQFVKE